MITPTSGNDGHGWHIPPAEDDAQQIDWRDPQDREQNPRELRWTCERHPTVYTLVAGGGLLHIRRDQREGDDVISAETERMPYAQAERVWTALMTGKAI